MSLQQDLKRFKLWCDRNQLTMNIKKTKYVTFGLKKIHNHQLYINENEFEKVISYKYLGITLDMNLNFNIHIENCLKLISHKAYLLSKIRKYIDVHTAIKINKSMILPIIEYGDVLYDGANQKLIQDLQTFQNRILRLCNNSDRYISTLQLHRECKVNMLKDRRILHLKLFMFKQKDNVNIVNDREVRTHAHDAPLFTTIKPNKREMN